MKTAQFLTVVILGTAAINSASVVAQSGISGQSPAITDPLAKELERCRVLNEKAASDERCQAAYAESKKRFFTPPKDYTPPPIRMNPGIQEPKLVKPDQPQGQ